MTAKGLIALRESAERSAHIRGHKMRWATPWHGELQSTQSGYCLTCGKEAHLSTKPAANGIDVGGEAVARCCHALTTFTVFGY